MSANFDFFKAPNNVFELGLNSYQVVVYLYLCRCSNNSSEAYPSYKTIADKCGMSKNKAVATVNELIELGLVKKVNRFSDQTKQSNVYKVKKNITVPPHGIGVYHDMVQGIPQDGHNKELIYKEPLEEEIINNTSHFSNSMVIYKHYLYEFGYERDITVDDVLDIFYERYQHYKKEEHPRLIEDQLQRIYKVIREMDSEYLAFYDEDSTTMIIDEFFTTVHSNDHRLNHFATEGIISILQERYK